LASSSTTIIAKTPYYNGGCVTPRQIAEALRVFIKRGAWTELRAVNVDLNPLRDGWERPPCTIGGYYPHADLKVVDEPERVCGLELLGHAALEVSPYASGVYFCLNPVNPRIPGEVRDELRNHAHIVRCGETTSDGDILRRRWLPIDIDPVRGGGDQKVSSTDAEKAESLKTALEVRKDLGKVGWPEPVLMDSGNGFWLLYRIRLPNDEESSLLVKRILAALAAKYHSDKATIDQKLFNAGRICKLPGTWSRKGQNTLERPHRRAGLLEVPDRIRVVPLRLLQALAAEAPAPPPPPPPASGPAWKGTPSSYSFNHRLDVEKWLDARGVAYRRKPRPDGRGRIIYVLTCPLNPAHGRDACIMQDAGGKLSAHCFHNGCNGHGWQEFKLAIGAPDPDHYEPPLPRRPQGRGWLYSPIRTIEIR
jgi:hypothetical protein